MALKCKGLFIVGAKRTPFCKHGGALQELSASHAFAATAKDAILSANIDPMTIDHTVVGNVNFLSQCDGGKTPRYCGIYSGIPIERPALGVNKGCASGIQAIINSGVDILTGLAQMSLTGGTEIMSALPHLVRNIRFGTTLGGNYVFEDYLKKDFVDSYCGKSLQRLAEELARKYGVTREEADAFALNSRLKLKAAQQAKFFDAEITSLTVNIKKKEIVVDKDNGVEGLDQSPGEVDDGAIVTRENSFIPGDGAAALILANEETIKQHNIKPLARVSGWSCIGVDPHEFGLGASVAVKKLLANQLLKVDDIDLFEINEIFSSEVLVTMKKLDIDPDKVNVSGGALSMGHPAAATGARMVTHLVHQISRNNANRAIATSASGGGQGVAMLLEKV